VCDATTECIAQLQENAPAESAANRSRYRIEEITAKIEEAKADKKKADASSVLRPAVRVFRTSNPLQPATVCK